MANPRLENDTHLGFGRGSAVREYWLMRCQGFSAVRADGRRLGRVKRVETHMEGTFLRLTGLRARTVPLSAVDTVWPATSLLVVSDERVDERPGDIVGPGRADRRPAWTDDTVPWWDLVKSETAGATELVNESSPSLRLRSARSRPLRPRMGTFVLSLKRMETFARAFPAWAANFFDGTRNVARAFARRTIRASRATLQAFDSSRMTAQKAVLAATRLTRLRVARSLFRIAVWVGGSNTFAVDARPDAHLQVDELDTEENGLGSGAT
jgi:hypothetical protein